jgi:hypothetical protein
MQVVKMLIQQTGTYDNQFMRPYTSHMDYNSLNNLTQKIQNMGPISKITGSTFAGMTGNLISPSGMPAGIIPIENGWNSYRGIFVLEIHVEFNVSSPIRYFVQGYTDYMGFTQTGAIDPNMVFYINSITGVNQTTHNTPFGMTQENNIISSSHVVSNHNWQAASNVPNQYLMRAGDIFGGMQMQDIMQFNPDQSGITDIRSATSHVPVQSSRKNNIPSQYIAGVVDGYNTSRGMTSYGQSEQDIISQSKQLCAEEPLNLNPFIAAISNLYGMSTVQSFKMGDLRQIDANADNLTTVNWLSPVDQSKLAQMGQGEHWAGATRTTVVSATLANSIPALMMEYLISKIMFQSTNHTLDGSIATTMLGAQSITGADMTQHFNMFIRRLEQELIWDFTWGNQERYTLFVEADLFKDTKISISLGSEPATPYIVPSFSDSLITPIIATDYNCYNTLVSDFSTMLGQVREATFNPEISQGL